MFGKFHLPMPPSLVAGNYRENTGYGLMLSPTNKQTPSCEIFLCVVLAGENTNKGLGDVMWLCRLIGEHLQLQKKRIVLLLFFWLQTNYNRPDGVRKVMKRHRTESGA